MVQISSSTLDLYQNNKFITQKAARLGQSFCIRFQEFREGCKRTRRHQKIEADSCKNKFSCRSTGMEKHG